jgi:hypothetical protein
MMELSTHDVVTMTRYDIHASSTLIIPDTHGLVVTSRQNPWQFVMEESCTDVVDMPFEGEEAPLLLIIPHLNEPIVSP